MPAIGRNGTCLSCATGFFTSDLGNTKCDPCDPGTFANVTGSSQCAACPQGEPDAANADSRAARMLVSHCAAVCGAGCLFCLAHRSKLPP